ncbi:unnamed protein product [Amoebophrya sp. A120]|nr:unnamed protein product [Amoebophrya sp. A120]|eukprot:GSA120T00002507001.1
MNFHQVRSSLRTSYITDPYSLLIHYKRAFKLLKLVRDNAGRILVLGNRNHFGVNWFAGSPAAGTSNSSKTLAPSYKHCPRVDEQTIATATKDFSLILCLDPILFAKALHRANLPVMMVATAKELHDHPEILQVTDYLLPSASSKHDAALGELIRQQVDQ